MTHTEESATLALGRAIHYVRQSNPLERDPACTRVLSIALGLRQSYTPHDCAVAAVLADRLREACRDMAGIGTNSEKWHAEETIAACVAVVLRLAAGARWNAE
jgi:hypothetical protein